MDWIILQMDWFIDVENNTTRCNHEDINIFVTAADQPLSLPGRRAGFYY